MAKLRVEIPDELEAIAKEIGKKELNDIVYKALRDKPTEALLFRYADKLLKKSKMTDELALKLGNGLKLRIAKKHGLI